MSQFFQHQQLNNYPFSIDLLYTGSFIYTAWIYAVLLVYFSIFVPMPQFILLHSKKQEKNNNDKAEINEIENKRQWKLTKPKLVFEKINKGDRFLTRMIKKKKEKIKKTKIQDEKGVITMDKIDFKKRIINDILMNLKTQMERIP